MAHVQCPAGVEPGKPWWAPSPYGHRASVQCQLRISVLQALPLPHLQASRMAVGGLASAVPVLPSSMGLNSCRETGVIYPTQPLMLPSPLLPVQCSPSCILHGLFLCSRVSTSRKFNSGPFPSGLSLLAAGFLGDGWGPGTPFITDRAPPRAALCSHSFQVPKPDQSAPSLLPTSGLLFPRSSPHTPSGAA